MKPLLVFDWDETLVYFDERPNLFRINEPPQHEIGFFAGWTRPFARELIESLVDHYDLALWSSASIDYILEAAAATKLFKGIPLVFIWDSTRCTVRRNWDIYSPWGLNEGDRYYVKKLSKLKPRYNLERVLIVDDSPEKAEDNIGNLVPIKSYKKQDGDEELLHLKNYLLEIKDCENFRVLDKRNWRNNDKAL